MKCSNLRGKQDAFLLRQADEVTSIVVEACRKAGVSVQTYWVAQMGCG